MRLLFVWLPLLCVACAGLVFWVAGYGMGTLPFWVYGCHLVLVGGLFWIVLFLPALCWCESLQYAPPIRDQVGNTERDKQQ